MLEALISSKTRIKLLMRLFLNPENSAYLRGLAEEFDESTNSVRLELNRFEEAGMLTTVTEGNKKLYKANDKHPLFSDLNNILLKYIGLDRIIETVIGRLGHVQKVYLIGDYAQGKESNVVDLLFVGNIDKKYLLRLIGKAEKLINKKIRYIAYNNEEWLGIGKTELSQTKTLLLWEIPSVGGASF